MRSDIRWCSDGFEFTCWNGNVVRGAFIVDARDREVVSWRAVVKAGLSGSDIRDMMPGAVARRFGACRTPHPVEMLHGDGAFHLARDTRISARRLGQRPCDTPPQSNGIAKAHAKTPERDHVHVTPLPGAVIVPGSIAGWIEDYGEGHPRSSPTMRTPREFTAAHTATA